MELSHESSHFAIVAPKWFRSGQLIMLQLILIGK